MAKAVVSTLTEVPEVLRGEYEVQDDGTFRLKLEGDYPGFAPAAEVEKLREKVNEFRANNIALDKKHKELQASLGRFNGVDPEEFHKLKTEYEKLKGAGVNDAKDVTLLISRQVEAATSPLTAKIAEMEKREAEAKEKLAVKNLESNLRNVAVKIGVEERAVADFVSRGFEVFNLEGKAANGEVPIFSKRKPSEPLSMEEWGLDLRSEAPHLFKPSKGGGAPPQGGGGGSPQRYISSDPLEFGKNLEDIASGKVGVAQ